MPRKPNSTITNTNTNTNTIEARIDRLKAKQEAHEKAAERLEAEIASVTDELDALKERLDAAIDEDGELRLPSPVKRGKATKKKMPRRNPHVLR